MIVSMADISKKVLKTGEIGNMKKNELKQHLLNGEILSDILEFMEGQDCVIYKAASNFDDIRYDGTIAYIPDVYLNDVEIDEPVDRSEIQHILNNCYTKQDFLDICNGNEHMARDLYYFVDWQHPNVDDLLEGIDEDEFFDYYGETFDEWESR